LNVNMLRPCIINPFEIMLTSHVIYKATTLDTTLIK
jgi:hypothetical protein